MKEKKPLKKRIWNWISNSLLALIILILIIPSWRTTFQGWVQSFTMADANFTEQSRTPFPINERNWALFNMEGEMINFADFKGKPIVISFWATWCGPCRAEMPTMNKLSKHWNNEIVFVAASTESIEVIKKTGLHESYDFLYATQDYPPFFEVNSFPTLAILDKEMNLVYRSVGAEDLDTEANVAFLNQLKNE